jgi:Glycosyltransferase like family
MEATAQLYVIALSNNAQQERELESNLRQYAPSVPIFSFHGAASITSGYNEAERTLPPARPNDILCFIHQDVRLHFNFKLVVSLYFEVVASVDYVTFGPNVQHGVETRRVGVLGFAGAERMTLDGRWWMRGPLYGSLIQGELPADSRPNMVFQRPLNTVALLDSLDHLRYQPVDTVDGYCMFIRRSVFHELGGFDERFDHWHFYDADLCMSAIRAGYQNYVIDQKSQHFSIGSLADPWSAQQSRFQVKWRPWFAVTGR